MAHIGRSTRLRGPLLQMEGIDYDSVNRTNLHYFALDPALRHACPCCGIQGRLRHCLDFPCTCLLCLVRTSFDWGCNMKKTAKQIWLNGKPEDLTDENVLAIIKNLYRKGLAEAWFIGMGWPEGFHYCQNFEYVKTFCLVWKERHLRAVWFACRFLD